MGKRKRIRFARITSLALTVSMIITMNGVSVAAGSVNSGVKPEEKWIKISSVRDFQRISKNLDGNYILTDDIDFGGKSYQPIGDNKEPFTGTLNGDGHILSNVNIEAEDQKDSLFAGLFGVVDSAKISDLAVEECEITSDTKNGIYAGVIAGKMNNTSLENVYVDGKITSEKDTAYTLGGIAGAVFQNNDTAKEEIEYNISSAVSNVEIQTAKGAHGEKGTLAGYVEDTALVRNSYALIDHEKLFGTELTEKNGCGILSEETRKKKDCYIGFDFAKVWKITKGGARLQSQTYTEQKSGDGKDKKETTALVVTGSATKSQEENKGSLQVASLGKKIKTFASSLKASANDLISLTSTGDLVSGDYTYTVSGENATITGYTGSAGSLTIPESLDGNTVTGIGYEAFKGNTTIKNISIPKQIASIGSSAFAGCSSLETVELHYNDAMINTSASGVQPYSLSIGAYAFENDEKLTSINLTENVTSIGNNAFAGCTEMSSLILPESLKSIGYYMIKGTKISSITIPKNVTYSVSNGMNGAMSGALKLNTVIFEEGITKIPSYICASDDYTSYITKVVIPDTVESIGDYSFYKCESLSTVSIPKRVASIGRSAFAGCSNLETVELHYNDEMINTSTSGVQPYSLSIGDYAFENDEKLTNINLTENVTNIGDYAFAGCTEMNSLTLPESLKRIGYYMIKGTKISSITIPKNVTYSVSNGMNGAMSGALKLNTVIFEEGMTRIPNYICASYSYTSYITKVVIPDTVESIGDKSFYNCNNLTIYGYKNSYAEEYATENSIPFVSVAISKNMTAAQVLAKLDTKKLLNNISLGSATVDGPTVTVGNKTFTLFSIPTSMDVELGDKVQAKVDTEKKTIQVMIGFDEFSGSAKLDGDSNSDTYWKESYKKVKSLYTGVNGKTKGTKDLYNGFRSMRHHLKQFDASMSVKASASAAGYIEFSYASGEIVFSNGGVLLEAELGSSWDYPLACAPAVYVTFGLSAGFDGSLTLVRQDTMNYTPGIDANFALKATMGVGAGAKKLKTYAEVGLNGSLNVGVDYTPGDNLSDTLTLKLKSSMYAKGEVFGYDVYSFTRDFDDVQLYPKSRLRMKKAFSNVNIPYELEEAENSDRTNGTVIRSSLKKLRGTPNITYAEKNVYKYCAPQLAYLNDGTMLLVWIDDDSSKTNVNKTSLMYSVFDGASWSTPQSIGETGGANDYPSIYCDGEKVDIVWQKADKLEDDAALTELLETVELYSVTYSDGRMGEVTQVTSDNSAYEMMQSVAVNGDRKTVVWVENSDNDPFQATGTESVQMAVYDAGKWTQSTVAENLENVSNLCASYAGDKLQIAYETVSGDAGKIVLVQNGTSTEFTGTNAELESGNLYYTDDKGLQAYDAATNVTEMIRQGVSGEFTVLDNGTDKALVTTIYNGYDSELVYYFFDRTTGEWSDEVKLTDEKKYIRDYSAVMDKNGKISAAVNFITIDEDEIYGDAELEVRSFADIENVTVSDTAYYDNDAVVPGTRLPLHFTVKNNGTVTLESLNIEVLDKDGSVLENGTMDCTLIPGEETELTYEYLLPETIANQSLSIKAYTDKEVKLSDNTADFEIGFADLAVGQVYLSGTKTDAVLKGTVLDQGYVDAENVTVKVYSGNAEGDLIETKTFNTLRKSDEKAFEVSIPEAYLEVNPLVDGNSLYVVAETTSKEGDYSNNSAIYMVKSEIEQPLVLNKESVIFRRGESAQIDLVYSAVLDPKTAEVSWKSEDEAVAVVDAGRITAVGTGKTTITAEAGGYTAVCEVTVSDDVAVTGISLSDATVMLTAGETKQITANVLPANATNKKVTWESSDPSVATVSNNGLVQALAVGKAEISAMTEDGSKRASLKVTVYQETDTICTVKFSGGTGASGSRPKSLKGITGTLVTLPENSYEKDGFEFVGWTDGKNTYPEGSQYRIPYTDVTLTAVWNEIPVVQYTIVSSVEEGGKISPSGETLVNEGESQEYTITAEEGYILADVQVDGESVGAVTSYIFEEVKGDHTIKALFRKEAVVKVESIVLDQTKVTLEKTQTITLNASIVPEDATDQQLKWTTSDVEVASVAGGVVTAVGAGTAEITAEAQDGSGVKAVCEVTVTENAGQPDPSGTPKPTADSNATGTPKPTEDPDATETSKPTADPNETETPKPVKTPENTRTPQTTKQPLQTLIPEPTEQPARVDKAGRIILDKANFWEKLLETVSFGIYKAPNTTVTIESYLENSSRYYYVDNSGEETVKDITALKSDDISWKEYTGEISLESDKNVVYAKIIDNSTQQEYYLCSDGIVIRRDGDQTVTEAPVTTGQPGASAVPTPAGNTGSAAAPTQSPKASSTAKAAVGKVIKDSSGTTYKVTAGNTVEYTQPKDQSLTSVVIPETVVLNGVSYKVTSISKSALAGCTKLKKASIGKNITVIGDKAFYNCKALTKIVIPASVVKIGKQAFAKCKKLKQITIKTSKLTDQSVGKNAFKGIYKKPVVKVPKSRKKLYKKVLKAKGMTANAGIK